jgi:hypothetical protein
VYYRLGFITVQIYSPSLHFKKIYRKALDKINPLNTPICLREIERGIQRVFKRLQATEFAYKNAE